MMTTGRYEGDEGQMGKEGQLVANEKKQSENRNRKSNNNKNRYVREKK